MKMFVVQELIDIDGIEHKPLKISGDPDKVEVRTTEEFVGDGDENVAFAFSVRNNT